MAEPNRHHLLLALREGVEQAQLPGNFLLAVSGGADSMALLRGMLQLREQHPCRLAVAHFNHQLRGEESQQDADWLKQTSRRLGLDCYRGAADIALLAAQTGKGIEETARDARYEFLWKTAVAHDFTNVALAHTQDDQAETILHHFLRGTGIAGLRGMPVLRVLQSSATHSASAVSLLRPMLGIGRREAVEYLRELGQEYREDPSNLDPAFTRNRIRHELLPLLEQSFNPKVRDAISHLGQQAVELQECLEFIVAGLLDDALIDCGTDVVRLEWERFSDQPLHLIRESYALLWKRQAWPRRRMNFEHFQQLAQITLKGGTATLPGGVTAKRRGKLVVLRREPQK